MSNNTIKLNIPNIPFGLIPSPEDYRDFPLGAVQEAVEIPKKYKTDLSLFKVKNQAAQPSCVAMSGALIKEKQEYDDEAEILEFSPRFLYSMCKKIDGWNGDGTYLRAVMKVLQDYGCPLEKDYPSDYSLSKEEFKDWTKIPPEVFEKATKYKIKSYARVNMAENAFESLCQAIYQNKAALAGRTGSNEGWVNGNIRPPLAGEKTWGHATVDHGYDLDILVGDGRNSWGSYWGFNGDYKFNKDYLPFEAWVAVDLPQEEIDRLKTTMKLIKKTGEASVYCISNDGKRNEIINVETFNKGKEMGLWGDWADVQEVADLAQWPEGNAIVLINSN